MIVKSLNGLNDCYGLTLHKYWPFPSPAPVGYAPHLEGGLFMRSSKLFAKLSDNVVFDGWEAVKLGHDIGFGIPHISIPPIPPNLLLPAIILLSGAKVVFARASVLINDTPAAAYHPMMPLLLCGDPIKYPTGCVPGAYRNTVIFSYDPKDETDGLARILWENIKSQVAKHLGGEQLGVAAGKGDSKLGRWLAGTLGQKLFQESVKKATGKIWDKLFNTWAPESVAKASRGKLTKDPMEEILRGIPLVGARPTPPPAQQPEGATP
jgi:hypothetical protein